MKNTKYYTPYEVSLHNTIDDIWVSYLGKVYNLTPLIKEHAGDVLLKPLIEMAGKDISHWFNPKTKDIRTHVDPLTGCVKYYTPSGRFLHVPPPWPCTDWPTDSGRPWWRETRYEEGVLSGKTRRLRIVNTLTSQEQTIEVCTEESLNAILNRYLRYNAHAASYTWKHNGVRLDMDKTLGDNGIPDEDDEFYQLRMDRERYTQAIHLYFNDDLTEF
ncbi:cytochrome b5 domain-containing protein 1 [Acipenser oxyrinchus oxyrinchus]|uniref:Cytochrome b5 domain-containing protein 1 n=1 Tax=Acipenser oxyrinchus oxyrinchus TaxID=40147 RepID=A0AAD8CLU1_ACIOX|nr:cytochrome b5 domain-containing protein 1 [Acipenser oxyrinchus oxyrinchus]